MAELGTAYINEGKPLPFWFLIQAESALTQISPDTNSPYLEDDKKGTAYLTSETGEEVTLNAVSDYSVKPLPVSYTFISDNPTKVGVDATGSVVFQVPPEQTASATITVTGTQDGVSIARQVTVTLTVSGATTINVIEGGVVGSARKALSDPMDTALSGANPLTQLDVYTTQDHTTPEYVRNTSFFLNSHVEALTCASPWNSLQGKNRAGTAVTKRHALLANHYPYGIGTTVRFIASDNSVITKTVVQASRVLYNGLTTDVWMVLFDSDLPVSITPCKIFPENYLNYFPAGLGATSYPAAALPLLALTQQEKSSVIDFTNWFQSAYPTPVVLWQKPTLPDRVAFFTDIISGDSGNPLFVVSGSEIWLLSTFHSFAAGPLLGQMVPELNAMIVTLDTLQGDITGHTVTVGDLSSYTTY